MEETILKLYFEDKRKQIDIAKLLNIDKCRVSRVITKDERYKKEKEDRKGKSKQRHKDKTKECVYKQRKKSNFKRDADDLVLKTMHAQASVELSGNNKKLSDRAYLDWNTSAYKYNLHKKRFEFREELGRSYAVKKYINDKI